MSAKTAETALIPFPIPYMGVDWSVPYSEVQHPYCPMLVGYIADGQSVAVANPYLQMNDQTASEAVAYAIPVDSTTMLVRNGYSAQTQTLATDTSTFTNIAGAASATLTSKLWLDYCDYSDRTFIYTATGDVYSYAAGVIASAFAITRPPNGSAGGICVYRDRIYVAENKTLYFAPIPGAVSGTFSTLNLASIIGDCFATDVKPLSSSGQDTVQEFLVVSTSKGAIYLFTGDFPGSSNWRLITSIQASNTSGSDYNKLRRIPGDLLFCGYENPHILSVRALLEAGPAAAYESSYIAKVYNFLSNKGYLLGDVVYSAKEHKLYFVIAPDTSGSPSGYAISSKDFTNRAWYDHWLFIVDMASGAISLHYPPVASPSSSTFNFRFYDNGRNTLFPHLDGSVYCLNTRADFFRVFATSGGAYPVAGDDPAYPALYFPYSNLSDESEKTIAMSYPVIGSTGGSADYNLYLDLDFERSSTLNAFRMTKAAGVPYTKRQKLPTSGCGVDVGPIVRSTFIAGFTVIRLTLQIRPGGP